MLDSLAQKYPAKKLFFGAFFAPVLIGILVGFGFLVKNTVLTGGSDGGVHIRGNKNAPVKIVEYSDFECPFCERHYPNLKRLLDEYGNKVSLEYKHFPLSFHPMAAPAALASECAAEQGKFWEFHDKIFENQDQLSENTLNQWADEVGVDMDNYLQCVSTQKYASLIQDEYEEGANAGVQGTPATFINGTLVSGAVPYEQLKAAVDAALK